MGKNKRTVGVAFTEKGRAKQALKSVVATDGVDAEHLEYAEDKGSGTAKVVDKRSGKTIGRFGW